MNRRLAESPPRRRGNGRAGESADLHLPCPAAHYGFEQRATRTSPLPAGVARHRSARRSRPARGDVSMQARSFIGAAALFALAPPFCLGFVAQASPRQQPAAREQSSRPVPRAAPPSALQIRHDPVGCFMAERYPEIDACFEPAAVEQPRVHFRAEGSASWSYVAMRPVGACYRATLPRPRAMTP